MFQVSGRPATAALLERCRSGGSKPAARKLESTRLKANNLRGSVLGVQHLGGGNVAEHAFELDLFRTRYAARKRLGFRGRHSHTAHAGVNLEMNGELSIGAPRPHCALQALDVIQGPDGRRELVGDHGIFFAAPVAGHQQQAPADAGLTQRMRPLRWK